jgi:hypothetical protein
VNLQREDELAWKLVEHYRDVLSAEERTAVFIGLGIGEYSEAIGTVLKAVVTQGLTLSERIKDEVQAWMECYHTQAEFGPLLSRAVGAVVGD